jgi:hypothetical protein
VVEQKPEELRVGGSIPSLGTIFLLAEVAKLVDAKDLKSFEFFIRAGSSPAFGTKGIEEKNNKKSLLDSRRLFLLALVISNSPNIRHNNHSRILGNMHHSYNSVDNNHSLFPIRRRMR